MCFSMKWKVIFHSKLKTEKWKLVFSFTTIQNPFKNFMHQHMNSRNLNLRKTVLPYWTAKLGIFSHQNLQNEKMVKQEMVKSV